jgi:hypothetical protein
VKDGFAGAKVELMKNDAPHGSNIAGKVIGGVAGGLGALASIAVLVVRFRLPNPQDQQEETQQRQIPAPLLDEIEGEAPVSLAGTAVHGDFDIEADDLA